MKHVARKRFGQHFLVDEAILEAQRFGEHEHSIEQIQKVERGRHGERRTQTCR